MGEGLEEEEERRGRLTAGAAEVALEIEELAEVACGGLELFLQSKHLQ